VGTIWGQHFTGDWDRRNHFEAYSEEGYSLAGQDTSARQDAVSLVQYQEQAEDWSRNIENSIEMEKYFPNSQSQKSAEHTVNELLDIFKTVL
jgi:hypothetical protein